MRLLGLKTFRHGIHPPECKEETAGMPVRQFPFAPQLIVPLSQHAGKPAIAEVREGQEVARGQHIARPDGFVSVSMHAPASGVVRKIALNPGIAGKMTPSIFIEPFPGSTQEVAEGTPCRLETATRDEIIAWRGEHTGTPRAHGFPSHHYNGPTCWGIESNGEVKHVYV
jgi:electron transport complex protein RnfC